MRREFAEWIAKHGSNDERVIFITGDLGYAALEEVQRSLGDRFINAGVSEQNMVSMAAAMAQQGLLPICYSIAPFAVFRPYEQIRLDVALHDLPVKIVGNGGGYGYGIMGASHHALEDLAVLSCLPNFKCIVPICAGDVESSGRDLFEYQGPAYLRLGHGVWPASLGAIPEFTHVRRLSPVRKCSTRLTVVGIGPVMLNFLPWGSDEESVDIFAISHLPLSDAPDPSLISSVIKSGQLLIAEEHSRYGGIASHLLPALAKAGIPCKLHHIAAAGYPTGCYGSQSFHQQQSGLDAVSLKATVRSLVRSGK